MIAPERPYSPETLGERWGCSAEKVRLMVRNGELPGFRLGKLIRIPAAEVERYECRNIPSHGTETNGRSPSETARDDYELRIKGIHAKLRFFDHGPQGFPQYGPLSFSFRHILVYIGTHGNGRG